MAKITENPVMDDETTEIPYLPDEFGVDDLTDAALEPTDEQLLRWLVKRPHLVRKIGALCSQYYSQ